MIINRKDIIKFLGISIIIGCAVFVCTLFTNFNLDMMKIKDSLTDPYAITLYDSQYSLNNAIVAITGACLLLTANVVLGFYIKNYINTHEKELGILKALGFSNFSIARQFAMFGVSVFIGAVIGFSLAYLIMPVFYAYRLEAGILPEFFPEFNFLLVLIMIVFPTVVYSLGAVIYGYLKLNTPALDLLKGNRKTKVKNKLIKYKENKSFIADLRKTTVRNSYSLLFLYSVCSILFFSNDTNVIKYV